VWRVTWWIKPNPFSISILPQSRKSQRTKKDLLNNHEVEALAIGERQARVPVIIDSKSLVSLRIFLQTRTGLEIGKGFGLELPTGLVLHGI
jgi:hypothetical protein